MRPYLWCFFYITSHVLFCYFLEDTGRDLDLGGLPEAVSGVNDPGQLGKGDSRKDSGALRISWYKMAALMFWGLFKSSRKVGLGFGCCVTVVWDWSLSWGGGTGEGFVCSPAMFSCLFC